MRSALTNSERAAEAAKQAQPAFRGEIALFTAAFLHNSHFAALCLDASRNLLHYEGYEIDELAKYEPAAYTRFDFVPGAIHHVTLVCENEVVVLYVDDAKALSSRIRHSIDGAHMGLFSTNGTAEFSNIAIKLPG